MPVELARVIVAAGAIYLGLGVLLLPWFWLRGLRRLDEAAGMARWTVKLVLAPGLVLLWPLLARRSLVGQGHPPPERNAHRRAAGAHPHTAP